MGIENLNEQELIRRQKLDFLKQNNIKPFGHKFVRTTNSQEIKDKYKNLTHEDLEENPIIVKIAGRIMTKRDMGKIAFVHIKDKFGMIQLYLRKDILLDDYQIFKSSDIGDIIGITGTVFLTKTNELSVKVTTYTHLSKALKPLPEKFHGLQDKEEARRKRYIDLIMNDESKDVFMKRSKIIRSIQNYLDSRGFIEVETPVLQPILGGAAARPFITHHNTLDMNFYLRIATELSLKRLIVGGFEAVYEIGRLFRNEGMDAKHNPEFTTIEAYLAYSDMEGMMDLVEDLFEHVAKDVLNTTTVNFDNKEISLAKGFRRVHMVELIKEYTSIDFFKPMTFEEAKELAKDHDIEVLKHFKIGHIINAFFEKYCESKLIQPTFVYGHPLEISPLAKTNEEDPRFTDRFELFINGCEYGNAFSELNDPIDQKERFINQLKEKDLGNDEASEMDADFIEALEYGMPPTGGVGIGIDRLVMLLTGTTNIRDVILFPQMKTLGDKKIETEVKEVTIETTKKEEASYEIDYSKIKIEPIFEEMIDFETFTKSDFRVVKVLACEAVNKSKKLLKFTLDDGIRKDRIILSGIHEYYEPLSLVGKTCVAILNLPPRKMMGIESEGMLISAVHLENDKEVLNLIILDNKIPAGAKLH